MSNGRFDELQQKLVQNGLLGASDVTDLRQTDELSPALVDAVSRLGTLTGQASVSEFANGRIVGEIDPSRVDDIIGVLALPHCGVPDRVQGDLAIQTFGSPGGRWSKGMLTYSINPKGANLSANTVVNVVMGAFAQWQAATPFFNFRQVNANGDIQVAFGGASVYDKFGSPGGTLGFGAFPEDGTLFFDSSETWTRAKLLGTALHEIGHVLGLTHSNSRTSLMYPLNLRITTVDAETRDAIRYLYGWQPQKQLGDRATSERPALAVTSHSTFNTTSHNLHMVWKGTGTDQGIYEADLVNNQWTPQRLIHGIGSTHSPALTNLPVSGGITPSMGLIMAWRGVKGDQSLYYATNYGTGWSGQQKIPGVGSSHRPALARFGPVRMAWKGINSDQAIYWSSLTNGGWQPQRQILGVGTSSSPALVMLHDKLYMFWKGVEGDQQVYYSWLDNGPSPIWHPQRIVRFAVYEGGGGEWAPIGSSHGPSATVRGDRILLAWKGIGHDSGIYFSLFDGEEFTGQIRVEGVGTSQGPGVCSMEDHTYMAWKGIDGDNRIYWSML